MTWIIAVQIYLAIGWAGMLGGAFDKTILKQIGFCTSGLLIGLFILIVLLIWPYFLFHQIKSWFNG